MDYFYFRSRRNPYRRNSDANLRELERLALANPGDEVAQYQYYVALGRKTNHQPTCSFVRYHLSYMRELAGYEEEIEQYTRAWPGYCTECGGWGGASSYYDPSPGSIGLSPGSMEDFDFCQTCVEQGICPRCGKKTLDMIEERFEDYFHCSSCEWDDRKREEMGGLPQEAPHQNECDCWEEDLESL